MGTKASCCLALHQTLRKCTDSKPMSCYTDTAHTEKSFNLILSIKVKGVFIFECPISFQNDHIAIDVKHNVHKDLPAATSY